MDADILQDLPGHGIEALVQGEAHRHVPVITASGIGRALLPFMVVDHPSGIIFSRVKGRAVVQEGLYGGARLPGSVVGPVQRVLRSPASHCGHHVAAAVIHDNARSLEGVFSVFLKLRVGGQHLVQFLLHHCLDPGVQARIDLVAAAAELLRLLLVKGLVALHIAVVSLLRIKEVLELKAGKLHQGEGSTVEGIAGLVVLLGPLLGLLKDHQGRRRILLILPVVNVAQLPHGPQDPVPLRQALLRVLYGIVAAGRVADSHQGGCLRHRKVRSILSKIEAAGCLDPVAAVSVEVRIAVELHDIRLGVLLLDLRSHEDLHDLPGEGLLPGQEGVLDHLLGDGGATLGDPAAVFDQHKACPGGGDPVHSVVGQEALILLGDIGVLDVLTDLTDGDILIMSRIDETDPLPLLIKDLRIGAEGKVRAGHARKLLVGHRLIGLILRPYGDVAHSQQNQKKHTENQKDLPQQMFLPAGASPFSLCIPVLFHVPVVQAKFLSSVVFFYYNMSPSFAKGRKPEVSLNSFGQIPGHEETPARVYILKPGQL